MNQIEWLLNLVRDLERRVIILEHDKRMSNCKCNYDIFEIDLDKNESSCAVRDMYGSKQNGKDNGGDHASEV